MKLKDKVAVITGGTSGIGLAIAKCFQLEGAKIITCGRDEQRIEETSELLGAQALVLKCDVSRLTDLDIFYTKIKEKFGNIDVLVANAGGGEVCTLECMSEEFYDRQMNVNLKGVFFTVTKAIPLLNNNASIILISSMANVMGVSGFSVYSAAKSAVRSLARSCSAELLHREIRTNVISPGPIRTSVMARTMSPDVLAKFDKAIEEQVPMKRFGTPEEVASVALFLASSDSSFILGEEIFVDGGQSHRIYSSLLP